MANFIETIISMLGRSAAYIGVGVLQTLLAYFIAQSHAESLTGFATVLAAINTGLFGGGMLKAFADAKATLNGNGGK